MIYYPHGIIGSFQIGMCGLDPKTNPAFHIDNSGNVTIGNWCIFSSGVLILTHDHRMKKNKTIREQKWQEGVIITDISIGDDVFFGTRCIILPTVNEIPTGCVIGAGSVLTKAPLNEYEIWAGNPARKIGERE